MLNNRRVVYWDACCFLSYVNGIADRLPVLEALLSASVGESGGIRIFTSALSKVEVSYAASELKRRALDPTVEQSIENLWSDPDATVIVEYHDGIGDYARALIRSAIAQGWSLKPLDAVHLATAQWLSIFNQPVDEFHTYDSSLFRWAPTIGTKITRPYTLQSKLL